MRLRLQEEVLIGAVAILFFPAVRRVGNKAAPRSGVGAGFAEVWPFERDFFYFSLEGGLQHLSVERSDLE